MADSDESQEHPDKVPHPIRVSTDEATAQLIRLAEEHDSALARVSALESRLTELERLATALYMECQEHDKEYHHLTRPRVLQAYEALLGPASEAPLAGPT